MKRFFIIIFYVSAYASLLSGDFNASRIRIPIEIEKGFPQNDSYVPYFLEKRPRIGLALSGGGARGFAQIGVLKVLEKHGLSLDCIAGTSIGAFMGGLYASGYTSSQIENLAHQIQWDEMIQDAPPRKQLFLGQKEEKSRSLFQVRFNKLSPDFRPAFASGQKLTILLNEIILNSPHPISTHFDELPVPLRIVCTDLISGKRVVLEKGSVADAMRASMAVPLLFTPLAFGDSMLVDGGLIENLPVSTVRDMGSDLVIAVDTSSKLRNRQSLFAPWEIADQVTTIMQQDQIRIQKQSADIVVVPDLKDISNSAFKQIDTIIHEGEVAAERLLPAMDRILSHFVFPQQNAAYSVKTVRIEESPLLLQETDCENIELNVQDPTSLEEIKWLAQAIYQKGYFQNVTAWLDTTEQALQFQVEAYPRINRISFQGNTIFPDSVLFASLETQPGQRMNFQKGRRDLKKIIALYHQSGYALARISETRFNHGLLEIGIDEGRISNIVLNGNQRTKPFVILRELPIKKDSLFHVPLLKQGLENIYSTGYFESVRFEITSERSSHTLKFQLQEQGYTLLRAGFHFDTDRKTQEFIELAEENLLGLGAEGSLTGLLGSNDRFVKADVRADRILKTFVTTRFFSSFQSRDYPFYDQNKKIGKYRIEILDQSLLFGQQMRRLGTLSFSLKNERIHLTAPEGQLEPKEKLVIRSLSLKSEVDTRDRMPYPQSGKYHILEYETGIPFLGSQVSYFKLLSSMESFYPLFSRFVFHPKICWGTTDQTVPFSKQFHLGGLNSFLGLEEDALVGKRFLAGTCELRWHCPRPEWLETYLSLRYDIGGMWGRYTNISTEDFKHAIGTILSFNTPFGPVQAGWGRTQQGQSRLYFSLGYQF